MESLLGPQWLCECNTSGGADTVEEAAKDAAHHYLTHDDAQHDEAPSVAVYKSRGKWLYSISTYDKAMELAYPIQELKAAPFTFPTVAPYTSAYAPFTVELGTLTFEQASLQLNAAYDALVGRPPLTIDWNTSR
jgi:hypothetical protein